MPTFKIKVIRRMKNPPPLESQSLVGQAVSTDSSVHAADDEDKSIRGIISCQHTIKEQHCTAAAADDVVFISCWPLAQLALLSLLHRAE